MPIQQIAYEIPTDLAIGIMEGIYKRFGSVVRDAKTGQIIKHLNEVEIPQKRASGDIIQAVKKHPIAAVGVGVAVVSVTAVTAYTVKKKKEKKEKINIPECVVKFEKSLKEYLQAIRKGDLDENIIDNLINNIHEIREVEGENQIVLDFTTNELNQLVNMIYDYTKNLAKINSVKLDRFEQNSPNSMLNLENYLEVQKQIFKLVA